jgi:hypothetical protein
MTSERFALLCRPSPSNLFRPRCPSLQCSRHTVYKVLAPGKSFALFMPETYYEA